MKDDTRIPDTWKTDLLRWAVLFIGIGLAVWPGSPIAMYLISEWAFK